ncbi:UDP-N-acetylmuramate dehydrogenase [Desulfocurvibacter africanus]|uniref:UDP-N-acetylmuramate dehydrogenase n=1 Tax=Desulfocurvibacter africanus TaxID=873 RepID=UPI00041A4C66|nr:UDP-N-acetylmuramate dehydrogenase [Desulfocurvibacter africanus]
MDLIIGKGPLLSERTTLRLGGRALAEISVGSEAGLDRLAGELARLGGRPLVLGWGSNLLAKDGELDLLLVRPQFEQGPEVVGEVQGKILVRCGAGVRLPLLLGWAARHGLSGLEGLAGIPGSVGGAVAMNAGSYGVSFCQAMTRARIWTPERGLVWLAPDGYDCAYRHFKPRHHGESGLFIVTEVELVLTSGTSEAVRSAMRANLARKKASQPITLATAGCVYKNPEGNSAGRLLDQAGFRGRRLGGMGFSELHANFLANYGGGTAGQALELLEEAWAKVLDLFGVSLELEVKVVG